MEERGEDGEEGRRERERERERESKCGWLSTAVSNTVPYGQLRKAGQAETRRRQ